MTAKFPVTRLALAVAMACVGNGALAAASEDQELMKLIRQLSSRVERLEKRNAELEQRVGTAATTGAATVAERLQVLEQANTRLEESLDSNEISAYEPEIAARLKAVERDTLDMKKAAAKIDALDGLAVGASLTTVAQKPSGLPNGTADGNSQLNYRADVTVELPLDSLGAVDQKLFAQFRMGQGLGLNAPFANLAGFAAPNAVAFRASGANPDDSVAILGQAWYQASIPLPYDGFKPRSRETLEITFGKMDIFGFFDQNAVAGDESIQFLNSVFVHNPLLDAGSEAGVDANGFQPGVVTSYLNYRNGPKPWRLSLGVFGTGQGANYSRFFSSPLVIAQAETGYKLEGLPGNYRAYYWRTGQGAQLDGSTDLHAGWGLSVDQRVMDDVAVFGRYGQISQGQLPFDRALTLGGEINGSSWGRGGDALGIAAGWLRAGDDYRVAGGGGDLDGDGVAPGLFAFTPSGAEKVAEIYYRYRITSQFELSPDFQYVWNLGANPDANDVAVYGLRAQFSY